MADLNSEIEAGTLATVSIDAISYVPNNATPGGLNTNMIEEIIELRNPISFDVVCEYGRNRKDKYWYCHSIEKKLAIQLVTNDGESAYLDHSKGYESLDDVRAGISRQAGSMFQIMKDSSIEKERAGTDFNSVRERLDNLEFLNGKSEEEKDLMAEEQCANNRRRVTIYTWYLENCLAFE